MHKRIAIVGAGIAGLACARELKQQGHTPVLFEKSRGPGGRMPTRWLNRDQASPLGFDHGAQYFQASTPAFLQLINDAAQAGAVAPWLGQVVNLGYGVASPHPGENTRWVGTPGMASLGRFMSSGLDLRLQSKVVAVQAQAAGYQLTVHQSDGSVKVESGFDAVVSAIPAEQVGPIFAEVSPQLAELAAGVQSNVTWSVMVELSDTLSIPYDGAFVADSPLGWICRDSSKPGRAEGERWVLQATADWSRVHQDYAPDDVAKLLLDVFGNVTGQLLHQPTVLTAHRWLYSLPINPLGLSCYLANGQSLGACGDWLSGARVEDAFLSGHALGHQMLTMFQQTTLSQ